MCSANPLISTQESSGSNIEVALHPLVLLSISDYVTRHTLRQQTGPIVGALLGQQNGRQISMEHAFECLVTEVEGEIILDQAWFNERMQQMRDVHKSPLLDLVGWYTTMPPSGPQPVHLPIHLQILRNYNESALLLGFYPGLVADASAGGKLPLAIFESNLEADDKASIDGDDKQMKDSDSRLSLKFKELSYNIETGEAEMISVDFVARGGGNATAADKMEASTKISSKDKGIGQRNPSEVMNFDENEKLGAEDRILSREDEELIGSLTTKINAIKMLKARINLITIYLKNLQNSNDPNELDEQENKSPNYVVLRSIQALLNRLALLASADCPGFRDELISEQNNVNTVSLLSNITETIRDMRDVGMKYGIIESSKAVKKKRSSQWTGPSQKGLPGVGDLLS